MRDNAAPHRRFARRDRWIAAALALAVLLLGAVQLTRGVPYWGDDSAGYLSEGIAIARGELAEQAARNLDLHPSPLPAEAESADGLVYVWGFPLLLSLVYKLFGFDMDGYSNVILYKLPSLLCLSLLAAALYLLLRRRLSRRMSAPLALAFCLSGEFIRCVNILYADVCFLLFSTLALLLTDVFLDSARRGAPSLPIGCALGAALWCAYETRLNGVALWLTLLAAQILLLTLDRSARAPRTLLRQLLPHLVFLALRLISERMLPAATSNLSDVGGTSLRRIAYFICYYGYFTLDFLNSLTGFRLWIGALLIVPCIAGFLRDGFRRENLHMTLLFLGTLVVNVCLPYGQRLRYLYGVLPILMLYLGWGLRRMLRWLAAHTDAARVRAAARALGCALAACALVHAGAAGAQNLTSGGAPLENEMYAPQAVEMYRYIRENTPEDAVIACVKPRALYLNTARMGFHAGFNGHELLDADYYLCILSDDIAEGNLIPDELQSRFELLHATRDYSFYRILPE